MTDDNNDGVWLLDIELEAWLPHLRLQVGWCARAFSG